MSHTCIIYARVAQTLTKVQQSLINRSSLIQYCIKHFQIHLLMIFNWIWIKSETCHCKKKESQAELKRCVDEPLFYLTWDILSFLPSRIVDWRFDIDRCIEGGMSFHVRFNALNPHSTYRMTVIFLPVVVSVWISPWHVFAAWEMNRSEWKGLDKRRLLWGLTPHCTYHMESLVLTGVFWSVPGSFLTLMSIYQTWGYFFDTCRMSILFKNRNDHFRCFKRWLVAMEQ